MISWGQPLADPRWFFSQRWSTYQRTNGRVAVYIERHTYGAYALKLYVRGEISVCKLEARITRIGRFSDLLALAGKWLEEYADGDMERIRQDRYFIFNPNGVWADCEKKEYYLCYEKWAKEANASE
jgi:hypothetical protein